MEQKPFYAFTFTSIIISLLYFKFSTTMNNNITTTTLHYLVQEPSGGVKASTPTLVLLHGVGSNEEDLFRLKNQLPSEALIISAQAPISFGNNKFGWYEVDFSTGKPVYNTNQEAQSFKQLLDFIDHITQKYRINSQKICLIGFSQGAIMSFSVALKAAEKIGGIVALSGRILKEAKINPSVNTHLKNLKVMIAHGTEDHVLPIQHARESKVILQKMINAIKYKEYTIGHQITEEVITDMNVFLKGF